LNTSYWWVIAIFPGSCSFFICHAIQLFKAAKHLPPPETAEQADAKKSGKLFAIICTAEGIGIAVGLHFFPLAKYLGE